MYSYSEDGFDDEETFTCDALHEKRTVRKKINSEIINPFLIPFLVFDLNYCLVIIGFF